MSSKEPRALQVTPALPTAHPQPTEGTQGTVSTFKVPTDNALSVGIGVGVGHLIVLILGVFAYVVYLRRRSQCSSSGWNDREAGWKSEAGVKDSAAAVSDGLTAGSYGLQPKHQPIPARTPQQTSSSSQDTAQQATPSLADSMFHPKPHTGLNYTDETQPKRINIESNNSNGLRTHSTQNLSELEHTYSNLGNLFPKPSGENEAIYMNVSAADYVNISSSEAGGAEKAPINSTMAVDKKMKMEGHSGAAVDPALERSDFENIYHEVSGYGPFLAPDAWHSHR